MTEGASDPTVPRAPGTPGWVTLLSHSLPAARDFYGALFGWQFTEPGARVGPYEHALRVQCGGRDLAGMGELAPRSRRLPAWTPYFTVPDADGAADAVRFTGGTVAVGPLDLGRRGRMALCADPAGAVLGVWQPRGPHEPPRRPQTGAAVWHELWVPEPSAVTRFYEWVFGCAFDKQPDGSLTLRAGGRAVAAIRPLSPAFPPHTPAHWGTHFAVKDVAESLDRLLGLGGRVLRGPYETAAGRRRAEAADPEGARFTLVEWD
ncbi:VOC family protein [Streptomyces polyrhachis]|uniref:VOC family protein n=1 Tax=Streptomyces polyrhachis TaxID=1282885 RepID=A0ABW2GF58_9ACTN